MIISKKVLLAPDTLIAFVDRAHPKHLHAVAFFRYFAQEHFQLYINITGLTDTYGHIYEKISPSIAKDFLKALSLSNINLIYPEEADMKTALKALVNYQTVELTFQETLMSVMSHRRNIPQICTFEYLHPLFDVSVFYLPI